MTFTIEQLEALKEGTTPGPWEWSDHRVPDLTNGGLWPVVLEADHDGGRMGDCTLELHVKDEDKRLIAAASALVDALIAEKKAHQKLRKRIEERIRGLKELLCSHMPDGDELDDYLEQWDRQSYEAEMLTDILEGDE